MIPALVPDPVLAMHTRIRLALGLCALAGALTSFAPLAAQAAPKRALTHDDYDAWKSLRGTTYSPDGKWIAYSIEPQVGDGVLEVRQTEGDTVHRQPLASGARFSADSRFVVFTIGTSKVAERAKRLAELAEKGRIGEARAEGEGGEGTSEPGEPGEPTAPRATRGARGGATRGPATGGRGEMGILDLSTGQVEVVKRVKGWRLLSEQPVLVVHLEAPEPKATEPKAEETKAAETKAPEGTKPAEGEQTETPPTEVRTAEGRRGRGGRGTRGATPTTTPAPAATPDRDDPARRRRDGTTLVIRDLATATETRIESVASYGLTRKDKWLYAHISTRRDDPKVDCGLFALPPAGGERIALLGGVAEFSGFASSDDGASLAFTSNKDDFASKQPKSDIYLWDGTASPAQRVVHAGTPGLPAGKLLSASGLGFSRDGRVLTFTVQAPPAPEPTPILPEEKVNLDLWHHQDGLLQTQQAKGGASRRNPAWTCVLHRDDGRVVVLGDDKLPRARLITPDGSRAVVTDDAPYEQLVSWDSRHYDVYLVNTVDGSRTKVAEKLRNSPTNSPQGRYLVWFGVDYAWHVLDVQTATTRAVTTGLGVDFQRSDDDHPHPDPAHGLAGWTAGDQEMLVYDEFDVWKVAPATGQAVCVTDGFGRANKVRLRIQPMRLDDSDDDEDRFAVPETIWLSAVDTETMAEGYFVDSLAQVGRPRRLFMAEKRVTALAKAEKADRLFFTVQTFAEYPDVWTSGMDFATPRRLTDANPQQRDIRSGRAELVRWNSADGRPVKGILIKPDGFDPSRKYPMLVYFYERSSQNLHSYVAPAPGTSPNAAFYVSNDYLWFLPDIHYEVGYPGESCVKCVVSGVQHLLAQGFVDPAGIGAAGHSWGGYQTAFLVTRTNIFAAVESGAPVSNMISAYGGIRYSSGMSRQFQYEQTQSRIGGTPWQYPLRYWENSPIFFADKVRTPVLLLHNDQDGAVPWTQGIEYFTALRRLGREVYLFNYNGEDHGLRKRPNTKDWSRRMAEYFDHHLRGQPMPAWMQTGVPYAERDAEKLPFTPSFHEVSTLRAKSKAEAKPAEASVPASTVGGGNR